MKKFANPKSCCWVGLACFFMGIILVHAESNPLIQDKVSWPEFLARHDLVWEELPTEFIDDVDFF